jgi:hypothetical protein
MLPKRSARKLLQQSSLPWSCRKLPRTLWLLRLVLAHRPHLVAVVAAVAAVVAVGHLISELAAGDLIAVIDKEFYGRT